MRADGAAEPACGGGGTAGRGRTCPAEAPSSGRRTRCAPSCWAGAQGQGGLHARVRREAVAAAAGAADMQGTAGRSKLADSASLTPSLSSPSTLAGCQCRPGRGLGTARGLGGLAARLRGVAAHAEGGAGDQPQGTHGQHQHAGAPARAGRRGAAVRLSRRVLCLRSRGVESVVRT